MEDVKNAICRFCFQLINDDISLISIDNVRIMVKCLLPDNDIAENPIICHSCMINLESAYNFMRAANENNLKILDATIENDDDLCQTCLKPVENTHVYLYDRLDNIAPLSLIKRMLECSLIFLNLEYRRYPVMCDDCWKILKISYSFLMCCIQNERQLNKEHNYTKVVGECNVTKLVNTTSNQKNIKNYSHNEHIDEATVIKREFKEEAKNMLEQYQCSNNALNEICSDAMEVVQETNENAYLTLNNFFMVEKFDYEDNLDCFEMKDSDIKSFEDINIAGDKITHNSNIKENQNIEIGENSNVEMNWPNDFKKQLYIKLERLVLTHKTRMLTLAISMWMASWISEETKTPET